MVKIAKCRN